MIESDITVDTKYHIPGGFLGRSLLSKADHSGCNRQTTEFTRLTNGREVVVEAWTSIYRGIFSSGRDSLMEVIHRKPTMSFQI